VSQAQLLERECPDCGAPVTGGQQYCLECGHRLPADPGRAGLPRRPLAPGSPAWVIIATGVVALIAASAVSAVQLRDDGSAETLVATFPQPEVLPTTATQPAGESVPTATLETTPELTAPARTTTPRPSKRVISWPEATDGWTLVLASVPAGPGNRAIALRQAREALDQGLRQVGVLTSSQFSSLHPGYLVVFSGVYSTQSAAEQALSRARAAGYEAGYTREIVGR
jgi:hypothetical protein